MAAKKTAVRKKATARKKTVARKVGARKTAVRKKVAARKPRGPKEDHGSQALILPRAQFEGGPRAPLPLSTAGRVLASAPREKRLA